MGFITDWFDGDCWVDKKVVVYQAMRSVAEFEFGLDGFGDCEFSDAGESIEEEDAGWW